jgi:cytochrome c553
MPRFPIEPHRLAAMAIVLVVAVSLAACSRKNQIVNPIVTGPVTWTNTVRHLVADRSEGTAPTGCTSCHHAGTTLPDWTLYANVAGDLPAIRTKISVGGTMRQFLKPGEPEVIIAWIDAGAPE